MIPSRREVLQSGLVLVGAGVAGTDVTATSPVSGTSFHFDHVVGTSLDVWCKGGAVHTVEAVVLDEIERLRRVFSLYDPESELSRLNRATGAVGVSGDLFAVLQAARIWHQRSGGALSALLTPSQRQDSRSGYILDESKRTLTRTTAGTLNLNSLAKGYIIQNAADTVRSLCPDVRELLVNLGGDLFIRGEMLIGVQNPHASAENAAILTRLRLKDCSVATSGTYQRGAHLIDPRTGHPAVEVAGATVIAASSIVANVLATAVCVLGPSAGLRLIAATPGAECLIVTADGRQVRSPGFAALETQVNAPEETTAWPEGRQVTIQLELPRPSTGKALRRPYVAIWIENGEGKAVRTLTVWGNSPKWTPTLTTWWKVGRTDGQLVKAVTRATRAPGKYEIVWDGKDDQGKPLGQGTYTVRVEVHREHGKHLIQTGKIACAGEDATVTLDKNDETAATLVQYAKKK